MIMSSPNKISQRSRVPRKTRPGVMWADRIAGWLITVGGIFVVIAVLGIMIFLVTVVLPLFDDAEVGIPKSYTIESVSPTQLCFAEIDEYQAAGIALRRDGHLLLFHAQTGEIIQDRPLTPTGKKITAFSRTLRGQHTAIGFEDGTVMVGRVGTTTEFLEDSALPAEVAGRLSPQQPVVHGESLVERTPIGQIRRTLPLVDLADPVPVGDSNTAILQISYRVADQNKLMATLTADGELSLNKVEQKKNLMTGKFRTSFSRFRFPYEVHEQTPRYLLLSASGSQLFLGWEDGTLQWYDIRRPEDPQIVKRLDIVEPPQERLTALQFMIGDQALVSGDSIGKVICWFPLQRNEETDGSEGYELVPVHQMEPHHEAVTAIVMSPRDKRFLTADADGAIWLRHMTTEQTLLRLTTPTGEKAQILQITPKADGLFALETQGRAHLWHLSNPHPESTWQTLYRKVHYEGFQEPTYTWQSSGGSDEFEPKLSLIPLVFGTLKATLYAMLFALPLAVLAAIYTSEFLHPKTRTLVKPAIEMMASLPSVVLGFIAALILAPFVSNWVVAIISCFFVVPLVIITCGYLWQLLPQKITLRLSGLNHYVACTVLVLGSVILGFQLGPRLEQWCFAGNFIMWVDSRAGTAAPLWGILSFPFILAALILLRRHLLRNILPATSPGKQAWLEIGQTGSLFIMTVLISSLVGHLLARWDARPWLFGTYIQRNTLIVGFCMGFAIIPIIYTIAEDALTAVPESLRSASLGCGATRWQTAIRVVLPTAASGIFSAAMVGLGRAVGETMIVVMAAGNTPILDINIFNGLRSLSANIAYEMTEAVKDGTLYRVLFLAALLLFAMTFLINTIAEIIRLRFRRRAYQL